MPPETANARYCSPRAVVIVNPNAGFRRDRWRDAISSIAQEFGPAEVVEPTSPEATTAVARSYENSGATLIVAAGGDGTIHRVINGIQNPSTTLAILPMGTANDFAKHLGLSLDPLDAIGVLRRGVTRSVDLVAINGTRVHGVAGFSLVAKAARLGNGLKARFPWVGATAYQVGALAAIAVWGGRPASVTMLVSNYPRVGNLHLPCESIVDDGLCEIVQIACDSRLSLVQTLKSMSKPRPTHIGTMRWRSVSDEVVRFDEEVEWFGDGEALGKSKEFGIRVDPKVLRLLVG